VYSVLLCLSKSENPGTGAVFYTITKINEAYTPYVPILFFLTPTLENQ